MEKTINANELRDWFINYRIDLYLNSAEFAQLGFKGTKEEAKEKILKSGMLGVKL